MGTHEQSVGATDEWYTPPRVFHAMGARFDLDVASPGEGVTPWIPAKHCITDRSLDRPWLGFVWMNPPFGGRNGLVPWLDKFMQHGNGVALVPDRTSAPWWQAYAPQMDLILFVRKKIKFIGEDGEPGNSPAQGTCLMARGLKGVAALTQAEESGLGFLMKPAATDLLKAAQETWQGLEAEFGHRVASVNFGKLRDAIAKAGAALG